MKINASKIILKSLVVGGLIIITVASPRLGRLLVNEWLRHNNMPEAGKKKQIKFCDAFHYLRKKGLIHIEYKGQQMYISLTKEGKKRAGKYKIDDLKIKKPRTWDRKWRILIFDIQDKQRIKREALRGKIKELGLFQLQKSVWVYPYDFRDEMSLLRDFFGLTGAEMKLITASEIEGDGLVKKYFQLS